jgi:hypothetical protein
MRCLASAAGASRFDRMKATAKSGTNLLGKSITLCLLVGSELGGLLVYLYPVRRILASGADEMDSPP